jgi:hypothetical protein
LDTGDIVLFIDGNTPSALSNEAMSAHSLAALLLACVDWLPILYVATSIDGEWRLRDTEWTGAAVLVRVNDQIYVLTYAVCNGDQSPTFSLLDLRTYLTIAGTRLVAVRHLTRRTNGSVSTLRQTLHQNMASLCQRLNAPHNAVARDEASRAALSSTQLALLAYVNMRIASGSTDVGELSTVQIFGNNGSIDIALREEFRLGAELVCFVD